MYYRVYLWVQLVIDHELIQHTVWAIILSVFLVDSIMDQELQLTDCVTYITELVFCAIYNLPVVKSETLC